MCMHSWDVRYGARIAGGENSNFKFHQFISILEILEGKENFSDIRKQSLPMRLRLLISTLFKPRIRMHIHTYDDNQSDFSSRTTLKCTPASPSNSIHLLTNETLDMRKERHNRKWRWVCIGLCGSSSPLLRVNAQLELSARVMDLDYLG